MTKQEIDKEIHRIGDNTKRHLDKTFKQWEAGIKYKDIMSRNTYPAKKLGLSLSELSDRLEELKYIRVSTTPSGKRWVFSGACPWTDEEIRDWLQDRESFEKTEKDFEKAQRKERGF